MIGVSDHLALLWAILPFAVLVSGVAPSMISFAAGQAGFTVVVVILFNIIDPTGWRVGLTRVEDVGIGCAVSVVVGLLFWPRGATAALGRALSDSFVENSAYLANAVDRLTTAVRVVMTAPAELAAHRAYLRLDDAFRQFLTERGAKVVPVATVANLFTGANRIRLAAYTLATLPVLPPAPASPSWNRSRSPGRSPRLVCLQPPVVRGVRPDALRQARVARSAAGARRDAARGAEGGVRRRPEAPSRRSAAG